MDTYRKFLPDTWLEIIDRDPVLSRAFSCHKYPSEAEPVAPFLFQDLRGGELGRLLPLLGLYGPRGLRLLEQLQEIDDRTRDTAQVTTADGQVAYAGYFFARPQVDAAAARAAAADYVRAINKLFVEKLGEPAPLDENPRIEILYGQEAAAMSEEMRQAWIHGTDIADLEIIENISDWFMNIAIQKEFEELAGLLSEPLYHIGNDYFLSHYLQWPLTTEAAEENPFLPYYHLWCQGLSPYFPSRNRVVLLRL